MQKAEAQYKHTQNPPAMRQGKGASLESSQGAQIAQLEAMAVSSPQTVRLMQLSAMVDNGPRMAVQHKTLQAMFGGAFGVLQAKTDVKVNLGDATDTKTSNKLINTPTQGEKWFRFAKDANKINSFSNNITDQSPAGNNPVSVTIELADAVSDTSTITSMSRPQHFQLGDQLINKSADYRTGTWTWHHKVDPYKMELVDMHAHGGFYHYGGFSQWDMDSGDSSD